MLIFNKVPRNLMALSASDEKHPTEPTATNKHMPLSDRSGPLKPPLICPGLAVSHDDDFDCHKPFAIDLVTLDKANLSDSVQAPEHRNQHSPNDDPMN